MSGAIDATLRVAAYCRVSTDKEDQRNSLEAQRRFFEEYIEGREGWRLEGIYADEGLSGTAADRRPRVMEMVERALWGGIDLIVTKEVSRFARNTVDALEITRRLRQRGVGVVFLTDGIDTRDSDGEFRLAIMASVAQEESRKISQRTRWGQLQAMRRGVVFGEAPYGYALRSGRLVLQLHQAEVVEEIYRMCLEEGLGAGTIARRLTTAEIPPPRQAWTSKTVLAILHNEKYCGDLVQKKTYTPDYLTHEKRANHGEVPLICLKDHHEPIVSRELWQLAQERMEQNNKHGHGSWGHSNRYVFSGKIRCAGCGASFVGRVKVRKDGTRVRRWSCGTAVRQGRSGCLSGKRHRDGNRLRRRKRDGYSQNHRGRSAV